MQPRLTYGPRGLEGNAGTMASETIKITDNRTGNSKELAIKDGTVKAAELREFKTSADDFGLMSYDPGYLNTASCRSKITFIDGDKGILLYRGYPIDQLAERASYLECTYLVVKGELPSDGQLKAWTSEIAAHSAVPANIQKIISSFPADAHPCSMLVSVLGALSADYPESRQVLDVAVREEMALRLIGHMAPICASIYRHHTGQAPVEPDASLSYSGNFLRMMFGKPGEKYVPSKSLERALDVLLILHLDHEQNCSTSVLRNVASSQSDIFCCASAAMSALYGPLHGGANEEVLKMLREIGSIGNVPAFVDSVKAGKGRLMGFGHRVYKNYDPRAKVTKEMADAVFAETGKNPLIDIAIELERIALSDEYFIKRKLYPNVDFYSGLIYEALKIPAAYFTVMFALGRTGGWAAHYLEMMLDSEQKIARPRQIYDGAGRRDYSTVGQK